MEDIDVKRKKLKKYYFYVLSILSFGVILVIPYRLAPSHLSMPIFLVSAFLILVSLIGFTILLIYEEQLKRKEKDPSIKLSHHTVKEVLIFFGVLILGIVLMFGIPLMIANRLIPSLIKKFRIN